MKKFLCTAAVLTVCLLALPAFGQKEQAAQAAYESTMSNLDTGGLVLSYRDLAQGAVLEKEALSLLQSILATAANGESEDDRIVFKLLDELFRASGIDSVHAVGSSAKPVSDGMSRARFFLCTPRGRTGLLADLVPANRPVQDFFRLVPREAFLAGGSALNLAPAFDRVMAILKKDLPAEDYAEVEEALNKAKKDGADVPAMLKSARSFVFFLENVPGVESAFPGLTGCTLFLETSDDSIYQALRRFAEQVSPDAVREGGKILVLEEEMHLEAVQSGKYLIVSTDRVRAEEILAGKKASLASDPAFAKFIPGEKEAGGFFLWTPGLGALADNLIDSFVPEEHRQDALKLIRIFGLKSPLCSLSFAKPDGLASVTLSSASGLLCTLAAGSASGGSFTTTIPVMAGMVLPAIQQARQAARDLGLSSDEEDDGAAEEEDEGETKEVKDK